MIRLLAAIILSVGCTALAQTQQKACNIPIDVITPNGDVVRGLAAEDFLGQVQRSAVKLKSLTFDDEPRRVLFIVDLSKKLSAESRKGQSELVNDIMAGSNANSSFALLTARGPNREVKFTFDHAEIVSALGEQGGSRGKEQGVLDAVLEGVSWFGEAHPGDAIVVLAADTEGNHKANAKSVAKALEDHHIRLFGLAFGPVSAHNEMVGAQTTTYGGLATTTPQVGEVLYDSGDADFFPLTTNSGGLVLVVMNVDERHTWSMSDPKLVQSIRQKGRLIANVISAFYRADIQAPQLSRPENLKIDVKPSVRQSVPRMFVMYPTKLGPC